MKRIKDMTRDEFDRHDLIMKDLMDFILKTWSVQAEPLGYQEFMKDYQEFKGIGEDKYDISELFEGFMDTHKMAQPICYSTNLPNVGYSDRNHGRRPMETLFSCLIQYGVALGRERVRRETIQLVSEMKMYKRTHEDLINKLIS